jgi:hypothetical protein
MDGMLARAQVMRHRQIPVIEQRGDPAQRLR